MHAGYSGQRMVAKSDKRAGAWIDLYPDGPWIELDPKHYENPAICTLRNLHAWGLYSLLFFSSPGV
jgi:hypothetical protein